MTPSLTNSLVLWDIDHTLLSIGSVSREIYTCAFEKTTGSPPQAIAPMTGRTERAIIIDTLEMNGYPSDETVVSAFYRSLGDAAHRLKDRMAVHGRALPGGREAIKLIRAAGGTQSLVTGNIRPIAVAKLQAFGLTDGLEIDTGGYGDLSNDRSRLVESAIDRTGRRLGISFTPADTVVIGDTPLDVEGAHRAGAAVIAVATGTSSLGELLDAGADRAVTDLSDGVRLVELISELTPRSARER
ncbi:HAD family hydrolase [Marinactinospora thermotolerans]|nr:haloacid dehalogenase-like hydrolase [Marinactinospora thermotolerans]